MVAMATWPPRRDRPGTDAVEVPGAARRSTRPSWHGWAAIRSGCNGPASSSRGRPIRSRARIDPPSSTVNCRSSSGTRGLCGAGDHLSHRAVGRGRTRRTVRPAGAGSADRPVAGGRFPLVIWRTAMATRRSSILAGREPGEHGLCRRRASLSRSADQHPHRCRRAGPIARRPLDIAFVAMKPRSGPVREMASSLRRSGSHRADIGYSMGGYGVLTVGGARSIGDGGAEPGLLAPYAAGGAKAGELAVRG